MNPIVYLIQVNLFLLLFYGFYKLFLRKETFNNLNRGYLVIAAITAFAVPFLQSDLVRSWFVTQQVNEVIFTAYSPEVIVFSAVEESAILWTDILRIVYLSVVIFLSIKLIVSILITNRLFSNFTDTIGGAFSFFGKIVVDESMEEHETIYRHEEVHSQHLHSADVILFEIIAIICWFNPVVYFYKNAVRNIHEFIADELASKTLSDKAAYATLLVSKQFNIAPSVLTNSFYKPSTIKLRIEMLLKKRSTKTALLKYGLIAPLFLSMMVLASATVIDKEGLENIAESVEVPLTELPSIYNLSINKNVREIEGFVKSSDGDPLAGAVITKKGSSEGTVTDRNGYFKLNLSEENSRLIISFVGFETREISIEGIAEVTVKLTKQENVLDEMVVVSSQDADLVGEEVFTTVEQNPEFPGGATEMYKYIGERIKYPKLAQQMKVEGKVFLRFVVQKNGEIGDIKILKGIGYGCDEEAVRVISQMPKWTPGKQNGKPVNVYFTMPIKFALEGKSDNEASEFPRGISDSKVDFLNPKVNLSNSESRYNVKVRGVENKDGSKPIFVIDGIVQLENRLENLNPSSISSINVIKGAAATSLYGEQAKNGAVQIITKKGADSKGFTSDTYEVKDALYIVDGEEMTYDEYNRKYKKDISGSTTFIYKSGDAVEKFGQKGKNGVIIIKTKDK
ncbi:MAG: TonB family protein [Spirosomaceae bacterium]|nr:TonB family protein [Spirosomataceae bacterium]